MDDMTSDDHRMVEEASGDRHADGVRGGGASPSGRTEDSRGGAAAARGTPPETEEDERVTKAKLIEYGRMLLKMKKAARRKARERAAKEKAQGLLTISFKCHKDDRRLIMGVMKNLNLTVEQMHKANLSTEPLEEALTKLLREFYKSHVKS